MKMSTYNSPKKKLAFENMITLALGLWVMALPLMTKRIDHYPGAHVYLWNLFLVGAAVSIMSAIAIKKMAVWAESLVLIAGAWLIISPLFLLYFNKSEFLFWNSVICGALISYFSAMALRIVDNIIYHIHKNKINEDESYLFNPHREKHF